MMIEARNYHCLVAGLPEITFGDSGLPITPLELKSILQQEFHEKDYNQLKMLLYPYDHGNLVRFLQGLNNIEEGLANFSTENFRDQQELFTAIVPDNDVLPSYMAEVMQRYLNASPKIDPVSCRRDLDHEYYKHIEDLGNRYVKEYTRFEYDLSNLLSFLKAARYDTEPVACVTGEDPFARHLKQIKGKSITKYPEFEYFNEIVSIENSSVYSLAEVEYDRLRWSVIEQITLFEDFTANTVLGYFTKLLIADRWSGMNESDGKKRLLEAVENALKGSNIY